MTAQSKVNSLATSLKSKAAATCKHGTDLLVVLVAGVALALAVIPVAHYAFTYWHTFASGWAPQAQQKAIQKRAP